MFVKDLNRWFLNFEVSLNKNKSMFLCFVDLDKTKLMFVFNCSSFKNFNPYFQGMLSRCLQTRTKISESDHGGLLHEQNYCAMYKSCTKTRLSEIVEHFEKGSKNQNGATFFQIYQIFWKVLFPKIFKATFSFSHIQCSTN